MLNRFTNTEEFLRIPWTSNRYFVNIHGELLDTKTGFKSTSKKNDLIELWSGNLRLLLKRSVIVALVFKVSMLHPKYWNYLDTVSIDMNDDNVHASNLIWKYPDGGLKDVERNGFAFVPGLSRYSINEEGVLYSHIVHRSLSPYIDASGYWMYGVQPDIGRRTVLGTHRLLGLAFLPYPVNVSDLEINHKDGVKSNNSLTNLEWSTYRDNIIHAVTNGLRTDNVPVLVMNSFTKKVDEHYSLESCGKKLGVDGETVRLRAKSRGQVCYPPGLQFKRKDDDTPWKMFDRPDHVLVRHGFPRSVIASNIETGEKIRYDSLQECANFFGLQAGALSYRLRSGSNKPTNNYIFNYEFSV